MLHSEETIESGTINQEPPPPQRRVTIEKTVVIIVVIAALKAAHSVVLPLVFALFLVAIFFPLHNRLQNYMRRGFATAVTILILLTALAIVGAILWASGRSVVERLPVYAEEFNHYASVVESYGIDIPGYGSDVEEANGESTITLDPETLLEVVPLIAGATGLIMLIFSYLILSLLEFDDYADRVQKILPANQGHRWLDIARQVSNDFQSYIVVRTLIGLISGIAVSTAAWLVGLEFAFVWGLLSFFLSYIPIFGSIIALLLPLLIPLAQFDQVQQVVFAFVALIAIRATLGTFVDPMLQGKFLKPTPLTVLLSVTFWGWLWGVAGAFIGVPLTILLVIICRQFQQTQWIAVLLADGEQE